MVTNVYVFIDGLEDLPLLCGELSLTLDRATNFKYSECYLEHDDAFALDPLNLPLSSSLYHSDAINSTFGVLIDAGADSWGKKVLHATYLTKPHNILEYLLAYSGTGVGCIRFSLSRNSVKPRQYQNKLEDMPQIITAKNEVLSGESLSQASTAVLSKGIGIGGARPKSVVVIDDIDYIAKFQRQSDKFNYVRAEYAAMTLLQKVTNNVAYTKILEGFGEDILLVKRFDCAHARPTHHFISGNSIINMNKVKESMTADRYSYGYLAEFILNYGAKPERDAEELFKRMVFNVLIGNTDDHPRNHAFVYSLKDRSWRLSAAYDVVSTSDQRRHALGIGQYGRYGSKNNLLSQSMRFGLSECKARKIFNETKLLTEQQSSLKDFG